LITMILGFFVINGLIRGTGEYTMAAVFIVILFASAVVAMWVFSSACLRFLEAAERHRG